MGGAVIDLSSKGRHEEYEGKTTTAVVLIAIVAASGGLLFGFDNGIMGGVNANKDFQAQFFPNILESDESENNSMYCK
jgi:MFS transporter, SP family, sugar:H+ symporter